MATFPAGLWVLARGLSTRGDRRQTPSGAPSNTQPRPQLAPVAVIKTFLIRANLVDVHFIESSFQVGGVCLHLPLSVGTAGESHGHALLSALCGGSGRFVVDQPCPWPVFMATDKPYDR
jgi:hypothetical protein